MGRRAKKAPVSDLYWFEMKNSHDAYKKTLIAPPFFFFFGDSQVVTKKRPKLSKNFKCPFCANQDTVECKMDFKAGIGSLSCRLCSAAFQMPIHHLHEPVDVFSEWLDECEAAQNSGQNEGVHQQRYADDDDDDDDDIPESSGLANRGNKKSSASANYAEDIVDVGDSEDDDDE